jgi:hypothetical protein
MLKIFSFLKILDEKIFALVADLKNSSAYIELNQKLVSLDDPIQKSIQFSSFALVLLFPIIILIIMTTTIYNTNERISQKNEILQLADLQLALSKQLQSFSNTVISESTLNSEEDLKANFSSNPMLSSAASKISYKDFNQTPLIGNYKDSQVTLSFNELSTPDLVSILNAILSQYKARITKASLNRSAQKKLLQGEISLNIISN